MPAQQVLSIEIDYERLADAIAKRLTPAAAMPASPADEYWSTKEIAQALGVHRKTVYDIVRKKGFPAPCYFTKERRWRSAEVLAWAARQKTENEKIRII
jgi:excisionase family DNA binding protein